MPDVQLQIFADASAARIAAEFVRMRLQPAPITGFLVGVVQPHLENRTQAAFGSESAPDHSPWAALAPETIERREAEGYGAGPIQYRTGELYEWFQNAGADFTYTEIGTAMIWPARSTPPGKLPYKIGSAQGGNRRTGAPPRPVIGLTLEDLEFVSLGLFEYVVGVRLR